MAESDEDGKTPENITTKFFNQRRELNLEKTRNLRD